MTRHIYNLSYTRIEADLLDALHRTGITHGSEWDVDSRLPFISRTDDPETIKRKISDAMKNLDVEPDDVVVVSGSADVVYYVIENLKKTLDTTPLVILVLGKVAKSNGTSNITLREVITESTPGYRKSFCFVRRKNEH